MTGWTHQALQEERLKYEQVERRIAEMKALEERLEGVPDFLEALSPVLHHVGRRIRTSSSWREHMSFEEALKVLSEEE